QRGDGEERIDAKGARYDGAVSDVESVVNRAVAGEYAPVRIDGALQMIVAHRASAQRVGSDQVAQVEETPGGIFDEVGLQSVCMPAKFRIHASEDLLLPGFVPRDADAAILLGERLLK